MPKMPDVYTADMGNPPVEQDAGILARRKRPMGAPAAPQRRPMPVAGGRPNPADAGVYTADKGMPPSPDDMGSIERLRPQGARQMKAAGDLRAAMGMKKGGCVKKMSSGGKVGSASKRADGCAQRGKTKGKMI